MRSHRGGWKTAGRLKMKRSLPIVLFASLALAGCAASGGGGADLGAMQVKEPMTHTKAAEICWMATEKTSARLPLDKRADMVERCIAEKMGTAPPKPAADAKKKTASAADGKKKMPVINGNKKKKPAMADAKKP
jgi:hypothetical protein